VIPIPEKYRMLALWALIVAAILALGAFVFLSIREPQAKPWDYGTTPFVPGKSPYSTHQVPR
jgi:hypothetical protein